MKKVISTILAVVFILLSAISTSAVGNIIPRRGDADLDGKITANDARLIIRCTVGLEKPSRLMQYVYDTDYDEKITSTDARYALRISVGLEDTALAPEVAEDAAKKAASKVSEKELSRLMKELCGMGSRSIFFPETNKKAADYIFNELKDAGFTPEMQYFTYNGVSTQNITAFLTESKPDKDILLLCAHYDNWHGSEGAIDNASGVAALLHTVRLLKEYAVGFETELRIAIFSVEEMGYYGAYHYLENLTEDEKSRLSVLNVDMAGNSKLGGGRALCVSTNSNYIDVTESNSVSKAVDIAKKFTGDLGEEEYYCAVAAGLNDIIPFERAGIPAATLSWREVDYNRSPYADYGLASPSQIHTTDDSYENFNMESLVSTTKLIVNSLILSYT